ncbi:hypothetical protein [Paenibacillus sp. 1011MAR3C5]|uniref:hypothetical protein n=1 Tax=Paenibacillus sp. 1011MAR3C5 TaxID=1675787 RepID=UPI0011C3F245|nr:hypothetical protein [Paenibacillus sp. 1011MAR3C5]
MASLILPRSISVAVDYSILNYFMTAPAGGIALAANTATNIGPAEETWLDDTGATVTQFAVNVSTPPPGTEYAYQLIVDGQVQEEGLVTTVSDTVLEITSATAATIPSEARIVFTVFEVVTTYSYSHKTKQPNTWRRLAGYRVFGSLCSPYNKLCNDARICGRCLIGLKVNYASIDTI